MTWERFPRSHRFRCREPRRIGVTTVYPSVFSQLRVSYS